MNARDRRGAMRAAGVLLVSLACATACSDRSVGPGPGPGPRTDEWTLLGQDLASHYRNAAETKISPENVAGLKQQWRLAAKGSVNGAAAVKDGIVYVASGGGTYALAASDGRVLWLNEQVRATSSPTWSDGTIFINDRSSVLHALDAATGAVKWTSVIDDHPAASGFSSPTVFERYVIVGSASVEEAGVAENAKFRGSVVAFDRDTGAELWRHYTVEPPYNGVAVWSSISIDPVLRLAYAATGNNYTEEASDTSDAIFALDVDTGSLAWLTQLTEGDVFTILNPQSPDSDFGTNPILIDTEVGGRPRRILAAGQKSGVFWALDRETGEVLWSHAVSSGSALIGGFLNNGGYDGRHILAAGVNCRNAQGQQTAGLCSPEQTRAKLVALDPATGDSAWERELESWVWAPVTNANGVGYVAVDTDLVAFDVETGAELFRFETSGTITSAPVIAEGRVHFGSGVAYFGGVKPGRDFYVLSLEGGDGGGGGGGGGDRSPTFSAVYENVFEPAGCNTGSCHGAGAGNLAMGTREEAYDDLVGVASDGPACSGEGVTRVVPGDPGRSLLMDKIANRPVLCGSPMPPSAQLKAEEIEQVRQWILRGAQDD